MESVSVDMYKDGELNLLKVNILDLAPGKRKVYRACMVDSPVRREIARRLLRGESSVWVLLESGDATKDEQALQRLEFRLEHLESSLKLPVINKE